jgi:hypothetical protein
VNDQTKFLDVLYTRDVGEKSGRLVRQHTRPLIWVHGPRAAFMPTGFQSDGGSVPRLPLIYTIWGDRAHRECHLHDYGYRKDAVLYYLRPDAALDQLAACMTAHAFEKYTTGWESLPREDWDWLFREAMIGQGRSWFIYHPMYLGVRCLGGSSFHCYSVADPLVPGK